MVSKATSARITIDELDLIEGVDALHTAFVESEFVENCLLNSDLEAAEKARRQGVISRYSLNLVQSTHALHNHSAARALTTLTPIDLYEKPSLMFYRACLNLQIFAKTNDQHRIDLEKVLICLEKSVDMLSATFRHARVLYPLGFIMASHLVDTDKLKADAGQVYVMYDEIDRVDGLYAGKHHERIVTIPRIIRKAIILDDKEGHGTRDHFNAQARESPHSYHRYYQYLEQAEVKPHSHTSIAAVILGLSRLKASTKQKFASVDAALKQWHGSTKSNYLTLA